MGRLRVACAEVVVCEVKEFRSKPPGLLCCFCEEEMAVEARRKPGRFYRIFSEVMNMNQITVQN